MARHGVEKTFYEFFAGGCMARAGLGEGWTCRFANEARYPRHYWISAEELAWLTERVEALRDTVRAICEKRLVSPKKAAGD